MAEQLVLQSEHLTKYFGAFCAVNDVAFAVEKGACEGIIGPNGAGKTTFFNLLTGLYRPTGGKIIYADENITNQTPEIRTVKGLVRTFQLVSVFDSLTILQNMNMAVTRFEKNYSNKWLFSLHNAESQNICIKSMEALHRVGLDTRAEDYAANLSYGQKRKLEIAMALALNPVVLLLDEPLAGLSDYEIHEVVSLIHEVKKNFTIVLIEHKISHIQELVSRLSVMCEGQMVAHGKPKDVINDKEVRRIYWGVSS
ncbi:MAG TPA: ABC transporter ATP-binding protein [Sphaerochaeta sp.]|nr:MAG: hypothetical protein A2Y31_07820 [Spirochaetes bacterium GWC2_52_13]HCG64608.1 ABC transporter ATP-binding protein [Sphaerochaeta sp.]HCS37471.1 ABC transporter ATP-binding protein [Sphaerochaeta sp.]